MIELTGVTFAYSRQSTDDAPVLADITLKIAPGTRVALLGQNGSGKSTLAKVLTGVVRPQSGTVRIDDLDPTRRTDLWEVRRRVGLVSQQPDDQIVSNTLIDDIAFGPENLGLPRQEIDQRVHEVIRLLGLESFVQSPINELSVGQKQRVAIAGILAMRPQYMIFDEPTTTLPRHYAGQLLGTIRDLVADQHIGVIYITHRMEEVTDFDRCVVLDHGRVMLDGPPIEVFGAIEQVRELGLDVPLATTIGRRLWAAGYPVPPTVLTDADLGAALRPLAMTPTGDAFGDQASIPQHQAAVPAGHSPLLRTQDLRFTYLRGTPFAQVGLTGLTSTIPAGAFVAFVGPTRAGKSTLVDCLNAIIRPERDMVFYNDQDVAAPTFDLDALRFAVGVVYQQPETQILKEIVGKDIAFGPLRQKVTLAESRARVQASLEAVGLPYEEFRNRYTYALSGGQKRRVAIAGVLAMHPRVLVLDEPTAGLDPRGRAEFLAMIKKLHSDDGLTIVYMTTSMEDILDLATYYYFLDEGQVRYSGTPEEILAALEPISHLEIGLAAASRLALQLRALFPTLPTNVRHADDLEAALRTVIPLPMGQPVVSELP